MFSSNLAEIMKKQKKTVREMVRITGLASATINKARQNRGISECRLSTLGRIANALEVPVKTLFDGEHTSRAVIFRA